MSSKEYTHKNTCPVCGKLITNKATYCAKCSRSNKKEYARRNPKRVKRTYIPEKPDVSLCKTCIYSCRGSASSLPECDYITITGHSRMCFGKPCDKYRQGRLKKIYGKNLTTLKKHTKHANTYKLLSADDDCIEVIQIGTGIIRRLER